MPKTPSIEISPEEMARLISETYERMRDQPPAPSDPGLTVVEYAEQQGIAVPTAKQHIRTLFDKGLLIRGKGYRKTKDGRWYPMSVYRVKGRTDGS